MNNLDFFNISTFHAKISCDFSKPQGVLVIPKSKEDSNELTNANHKLIDLITTYKTLKNITPLSDQTDVIVNEIIALLDKTKHINYTPFCVYFQVLKYSYNSYINAKNLSHEDKFNLIKDTIEAYINNRHDIYVSHGYSDQVLQVMCDASSSRRNGATGTDSLASLLSGFNIPKVDSFEDFQSKPNAFILPDKGNSDVFKKIIESNEIEFDFQKTRENKMPDMAFKLNGEIYIVEHKLTSGAGGAQNMEINEIISFIGHKENKQNIHYISCLEGDYLQKLNSENSEPKAKAQYENIINNLNNNPNNYFVNEFGLKSLLDHILYKRHLH